MAREPSARAGAAVRTDRVVAGVVFVLLGGAFLLDDAGVWRFQLVLVWPISLIAIGVAVLLGRARREQAEESRRAQLAVAEERVRIARDLHDIVAHGVSLMTIQIAGARRVTRTKPDVADEALRQRRGGRPAQPGRAAGAGVGPALGRRLPRRRRRRAGRR